MPLCLEASVSIRGYLGVAWPGSASWLSRYVFDPKFAPLIGARTLLFRVLLGFEV